MRASIFIPPGETEMGSAGEQPIKGYPGAGVTDGIRGRPYRTVPPSIFIPSRAFAHALKNSNSLRLMFFIRWDGFLSGFSSHLFSCPIGVAFGGKNMSVMNQAIQQRGG